MSDYWFLFLFFPIPIAFVAGWWISRKKYISGYFRSRRNLYPDYFRGLNYVLNEQPDKAIEIFIKMIEVDSETIETHLALGNLFRRRGEVDRAVRIHQNLIARPNLSREYRGQAYLELGKDYLKLGILDRAEKLFLDLIDMEILPLRSNEYLLEIYQQQRDWGKSINIARKLETLSSGNYAANIAQYYCELASEAIDNDNEKNAKDYIKRAIKLDPSCVRASIMEAELLFKNENFKGSIAAYKRVEKQDPEYIGEILLSLEKSYQKIGKEEQFKKYLFELAVTYNDKYFMLKVLAETMAEDEGYEYALEYLEKNLQVTPNISGIRQLLMYMIASENTSVSRLQALKKLIDKMLESRAAYQCHKCGFETRQLHWFCPGCKSWNSIKPRPI